MNMPLLIGIIAMVIIFYSIINAIGNAKHPIKKSIINVITGITALIAVNLLAPMTGVSIPVSVLSILIAVIGGVPGVTLILSLSAFF